MGKNPRRWVIATILALILVLVTMQGICTLVGEVYGLDRPPQAIVTPLVPVPPNFLKK